jgi:hypothetical protein
VQRIPKKRMREGGRCSLEEVVMQLNEEVVKELSPNVTPYRKETSQRGPGAAAIGTRILWVLRIKRMGELRTR